MAIEEIQKGDLVYAWNEETGETGLKEVLETCINETEELIHVHVAGEEIVRTPAHPFYSPVKGWTKAADLRAGDILVLKGGEYVIIKQVEHEILEAPVRVYNLNVAEWHTYFASEAAVLVHNMCKPAAESKRFDENTEALIQMDKDDLHRGSISPEDADAYWDIVKELGLDVKKNYHGPQVDRFQGGIPHIKINGMHIIIQ